MSKRRDEEEHERTARLLQEYVAEQDRRRLKAERRAAPVLVVTFCELADADVRFVAAPWRRGTRGDAHLEAMLRCDARAIHRTIVRSQPEARALRRLHARAPVRATGRFVYTSTRARALLAWLEDQPRSSARDCLLRPLRGAVRREHAFAIVFDTI